MPDITIIAREATLQSDPWENVLKVIATDCRVEMGKGSSSFHCPELELPIPLSDASRVDERSRHPSCLALWRIPGEIATQQEAIQRQQEDMAATAAFQMLTGDFNALTSPAWGGQMANANDLRSRLYRLQTEPYRRWSLGFSCLFFVWVGAPMAMWLRNKDFLTSFFLCFAPILILYYPLLAYGIDGAKGGTFPPISVWAGNVVLLAIGALLLRKVLRY
jgi:lipopolysaccharide export system permease protein